MAPSPGAPPRGSTSIQNAARSAAARQGKVRAKVAAAAKVVAAVTRMVVRRAATEAVRTIVNRSEGHATGRERHLPSAVPCGRPPYSRSAHSRDLWRKAAILRDAYFRDYSDCRETKAGLPVFLIISCR